MADSILQDLEKYNQMQSSVAPQIKQQISVAPELLPNENEDDAVLRDLKKYQQIAGEKEVNVEQPGIAKQLALGAAQGIANIPIGLAALPARAITAAIPATKKYLGNTPEEIIKNIEKKAYGASAVLPFANLLFKKHDFAPKTGASELAEAIAPAILTAPIAAMNVAKIPALAGFASRFPSLATGLSSAIGGAAIEAPLAASNPEANIPQRMESAGIFGLIGGTTIAKIFNMIGKGASGAQRKWNIKKAQPEVTTTLDNITNEIDNSALGSNQQTVFGQISNKISDFYERTKDFYNFARSKIGTHKYENLDKTINEEIAVYKNAAEAAPPDVAKKYQSIIDELENYKQRQPIAPKEYSAQDEISYLKKNIKDQDEIRRIENHLGIIKKRQEIEPETELSEIKKLITNKQDLRNVEKGYYKELIESEKEAANPKGWVLDNGEQASALQRELDARAFEAGVSGNRAIQKSLYKIRDAFESDLNNAAKKDLSSKDAYEFAEKHLEHFKKIYNDLDDVMSSEGIKLSPFEAARKHHAYYKRMYEGLEKLSKKEGAEDSLFKRFIKPDSKNDSTVLMEKLFNMAPESKNAVQSWIFKGADSPLKKISTYMKLGEKQRKMIFGDSPFYENLEMLGNLYKREPKVFSAHNSAERQAQEQAVEALKSIYSPSLTGYAIKFGKKSLESIVKGMLSGGTPQKSIEKLLKNTKTATEKAPSKAGAAIPAIITELFGGKK